MSRNLASCLVPLSSGSGLEMNAYLVFNKKTSRQEQKLVNLHRYVEKYSSGWKKRLELADLLYEMGRWSEAVLEYECVINKKPYLVKPRIQLGRILQLLNRQREAIAVYEEAIVLVENAASKEHLTGLIETCRGNSKGAITAFQSAASLEPPNLAHWLALGQLMMEAERPADALSTFETLLSLDPNNLMGLVYSYDLFLALGNFSEAENCLNRALAVAPEDVQTLKRAIAHRCRKRLVFDAEGKQTKKLISSLLKTASSSAEAHNFLAHYYILRGEPQKAIKIFKQFTEAHSRNPHAWYYYSQRLLDIGEQEAAAEAILKAHRLFCRFFGQGSCILDHLEVYRALCEILPATGRLDQSRAIVAQMLEKFPESWSVWAIAGRVLVKYFRDERGCDYSLRGTQLQPQLADAWLRHGRVLTLAGKHQEAIAALTQGWQLLLPEAKDFKSVSASVWLGESYQTLGNESASQTWLKIALQKVEKLIEFEPVRAKEWQERALASLKKL